MLGKGQTGLPGATCPGTWLGEALCRPGAPLLVRSPIPSPPPAAPAPTPGTRVTAVYESKAFCSSLILASLYLCRFQFKMAFPGAFLNPNTNNSF